MRWRWSSHAYCRSASLSATVDGNVKGLALTMPPLHALADMGPPLLLQQFWKSMRLPLEGLSQAAREVIASVTTQVSAIIVSIHYLVLSHLISSYVLLGHAGVAMSSYCARTFFDRYKDVCSINDVHKTTWQSILPVRSLCSI